jgi:superfamily II DNA or RNA helicase
MPGPSAGPRSIASGWLDTLPPGADILRDYQRQLIAGIAAELHAGHVRILAQAPTGAGKTVVIAAIVLAAQAAGLRVLVLVTRTRLVRQVSERFQAFNIRHGVIAAPLPHLRNYSAGVQVASVDTLYRRALGSKTTPLPSADVVIFDEAHLATAETRLQLLDSYPDAIRIGFTATPARKSGKSLGAAFDCMVLGPSIKALTAAGVLVPTRIFNTPLLGAKELQSIPKDTDSDYKAGELAAALSRPKLIGDVANNWLRIANGKRTLCFAVNKAHGAALLESFRVQGIAAELLTDNDDEDTREEVIARLTDGRTHVVINCFLLAYGLDVPTVECVILARPTRSLTMYLQMVGRGLRSAPGKTECIVIDHGHVIENLGLPQTDFEWSLAPDDNVNVKATEARLRKAATEALRTCRECMTIWLTSESGNACPSCGWAAAPRAKPVTVIEADLEELADDPAQLTVSDARVLTFYREACGWRAARKPQLWLERPKSVRWWAWCETRAMFQIAESVRKPGNFWDATPLPPSVKTSGWLKSRQIAYAHRPRTSVA